MWDMELVRKVRRASLRVTVSDEVRAHAKGGIIDMLYERFRRTAERVSGAGYLVINNKDIHCAEYIDEATFSRTYGLWWAPETDKYLTKGGPTPDVLVELQPGVPPTYTALTPRFQPTLWHEDVGEVASIEIDTHIYKTVVGWDPDARAWVLE